MISFIIIFLYVLYILLKYGVPHSLSQTYYILGKYGWIFSVVLILSVGFITPQLLELDYSYLAFISIAGVLFVAFAPNFMSDKLVDDVHVHSARIALIASQIWVYLHSPLILLLWIPIGIYGLISYLKNKNFGNIKFWGEIVMLLTVYLVTLVKVSN